MNVSPQSDPSRRTACHRLAKWSQPLLLLLVIGLLLANCAAPASQPPAAPASSASETAATAPAASAEATQEIEPLSGLSVLDTPAPAPTEVPVAPPAGTPLPADAAASVQVEAPTRSPAPAAMPSDLLGSQKTPPEGIPEQIFNTGGVFMEMGEPVCTSTPSAGPEVYPLGPQVIEFGGFLDICLAGFAPGQAIDILVTGPNGEVWPAERTAGPDGTATVTWESAAGEPLGEYTVAASQGSSRAEGMFNVVEPAPVIDVPFFGERGDRIPVQLRNFPPDELVTLHIYYAPLEASDTEMNSYWSSLDLMTDAQGQADYELVMALDHQPGRYVFAYLEPRATEPTVTGTLFLR